MAFTLYLLISLFIGLVLFMLGVVFIVIRKARLPGLILLAAGMLMTLTTSAVFVALLITMKSMG